jgi:hypothetical protein
MNGIVAPNGAARGGNVHRDGWQAVNRLRQNEGRIDRLRSSLLMLAFSSGAALVGLCLRPLGGTTGVGGELVWALTLGAAVLSGLGRRLPACAGRDAGAQEGEDDQGGNCAGEHRPQSIAPKGEGRHAAVFAGCQTNNGIGRWRFSLGGRCRRVVIGAASALLTRTPPVDSTAGTQVVPKGTPRVPSNQTTRS